MKVLISAYACEPGKGSEPGIGWNCVKEISRNEQCWVITRANNRPAIERNVEAQKAQNIRFIYYDLPRWASFWKKGLGGVYPYYYLWQVGAYRLARGLHREVNFDLVHHITFGTYWMPSLVSLLPVPFIWGPVGGGESAPRNFDFSYSGRGIVYEFLRNLVRKVGEFDPLVRMTARRASVCLATTTETADRLKSLGCRNVSVVSPAALSPTDLRQLRNVPIRHTGPFRMISIGRLLHWKGFDLGLKAFAQFHRTFPESEYWIIGGGPEADRLRNIARGLDIERHTKFWGELERAEVLEKMSGCDVLVHPSLHDSSGWVTIEAMASGRPIICLDLGGPALQVTQATGIKVRVESPAQVVSDLSAAMGFLALDQHRRIEMGVVGRARAEELYNWSRKGDEFRSIYARVVGNPESNKFVVNEHRYCEVHHGEQ